MAEPPASKPILANIGRTEFWWLPLIPLASLPLFRFALGYVEQIVVYDADPSFLYYLVFIFSIPFAILALLSPILLPIYAVYLVRLTWQRFKDGTLTLSVSLLHILSFIVPFGWFLMFATFSGSPA